jgi:crossover junction endodeoxyribonuclease RuvC
MEVCGIDPGLHNTGYAVLSLTTAVPRILDAGVLRPPNSAGLADRLVHLSEDLAEVLEQWKPAIVAFEQLYSHYKHPRTAIQMGHARGVLLAEARRHGARVVSYSATRIKRHLTGNGRASKIQVQRTVQSLFGLDAPPEPPDVADALAVAFCCCRECDLPFEEMVP